MHSTTNSRRRLVLAAATLLLPALPALGQSAGPIPATCLVPAKAGGGFELTCKLVAEMVRLAHPLSPPVAVRYLPGGIGAVAYDHTVTTAGTDPQMLVAFSGGSLLNLAQGKFGPHGERDVRWLAIIGTDYGVLAVHRDSRLRNMDDLRRALQANPAGVVFGAGGTVGSQDWIKAALVVRGAARDHKSMRFVAFEGGGDALGALQGRHVDVFSGDAAEAVQAIDAGAPLRLLAVLSDARLPGRLADVPTAREQGFDLVWPTVRGLYLGPGVSDADYRRWIDTMRVAMASPAYPAMRARYGLYPRALLGAELDAFVASSVAGYRAVASNLGLRVR